VQIAPSNRRVVLLLPFTRPPGLKRSSDGTEVVYTSAASIGMARGENAGSVDTLPRPGVAVPVSAVPATAHGRGIAASAGLRGAERMETPKRRRIDKQKASD